MMQIPEAMEMLLEAVQLHRPYKPQPGGGAERARTRLIAKRKREQARDLPNLPETRQQRRLAQRQADKAWLSSRKRQARIRKRKGGSAPIKRLEQSA